MIFEPDSDDHYSCWIDGFLPKRDRLEKIIYNVSKKSIKTVIDDYMILDTLSTKIQSKLSNSKKETKNNQRSFIQIMKPIQSSASKGILNPILEEYSYMKLNNEDRDQYRIFLLISEASLKDKNDTSQLKSTLTNSIDELKINIKNPNTYKSKNNIKKQFSALSSFFIESYFLPYSQIKNRLNELDLSFDGEVI